MHFYPHNIPDFNNATRHLTRVERSVYRDAIERYYDTEEALPADDFNKLARILLCSTQEEKDALKLVLDEFFILTDVGHEHDRCNAEIAKYRLNSTAKARAGKASAEARKSKRATPVEHPLNSVEQTNNYELVNNNEEIINNLKDPAQQAAGDLLGNADESKPEKQKKELAQKFKPESLADQMPSPLCDWWLKWVDYRRARKLSTKEPTWRAQANNLSEWGKKGLDPCQAIKASIENGWAGLFEPKPKHVGVNHAGQPKSPIERFMQQHYPDAGSGFENDQRPMGGNDGFVRGAMDSELRGSAGQVGTMAPDIIGDFSRTDS